MEQQVVLSPEDWSVVRITLSNESTRKRANQPEKADRLLAVLQRIEAQTRGLYIKIHREAVRP